MRFTHVVPAPLEETFAWHTRPGGFPRLQPPWLPLRVVTEAGSLADGRAVVALPGGLRWVAQHDPRGFDHGRSFADDLVPAGVAGRVIPALVRWHHTHEFEEVAGSSAAVGSGTAGGTVATRITDTVETNLPRRTVERMFTYRAEQLTADLEAHAWARERRGGAPLTVAMTGSSGLIGRALSAFLTTGGHRVIRLVRGTPRGGDERRWDPRDPYPGLLSGVDALVHLAGEPILGRFSSAHKERVRGSRVPPTRALAHLLARDPRGPKVFISASAIGFYGPSRGDEELTEASARGEGFLADVVSEWEEATAPAREAGVRVVNIRTGLVLGAGGGMLGLLRPLFAAGLGGRIGHGRQWMSWIGLDDLVYVYHRALMDPAMRGPVNAVTPNPVRNAEFTRTLARVLRRPAIIPVPAAGPAVLLGAEGAREFALADQRVIPAALETAGTVLRRPTLEAALRHELGRTPSQGASLERDHPGGAAG